MSKNVQPHASMLRDVMRAEHAGKDLQEHQFRMCVFAMRQDGTLYELGSVCMLSMLQDKFGSLRAIERIKFTRRDTDLSA